jgi:diguanylate cyclase (GGDEF)-like protein
VLRASSRLEPEAAGRAARVALASGASGRSVQEERLVVIDDHRSAPGADPAMVAEGIRSMMAAPLRERGVVVGSLAVGTRGSDRRYSALEQEMLVKFAEHASLALTQARAVQDAIDQALHDPLTGLPNRTLLRDRLDHALTRATRTRGSAALAFLDLDGFKEINDNLGHAAGDELLAAFARRLRGCVRAGDTTARYGGDEFAILVEEVNRDDVAATASRILEALTKPFVIGGREVAVGACMGVALGSNGSDELLRNADLALYRAKSKGSGQYEVFEP